MRNFNKYKHFNLYTKMIIDNDLYQQIIISIKNIKPASKKFLCPDIKTGVCYFKKKG